MGASTSVDTRVLRTGVFWGILARILIVFRREDGLEVTTKGVELLLYVLHPCNFFLYQPRSGRISKLVGKFVHLRQSLYRTEVAISVKLWHDYFSCINALDVGVEDCRVVVEKL